MSESKQHEFLVSLIVDYVETLINKENISLINVDSGNKMGSCLINYKYIPDVFYCYKDVMIIGEAKTSKDFDRKHSLDQFSAYLDECINFWGNSILIIAVPWTVRRTAINYFLIKMENFETNIKIVIIDEYGKKEEL